MVYTKMFQRWQLDEEREKCNHQNIPTFLIYTCLCKASSVVQSQKAVSAHFTNKQILPFDFARQYLWRSNTKSVENLLPQKNFARVFSFVQMRQKQGAVKWNESGFRSPLCTHRLNWARRTSWGLWDEWDDTVLQTQDSKFEPWRSKAEHATSRSRRLPTILSFTRGWGRNFFCFFQTAETGNQTLNSSVKGSGANHYPRAPAQRLAESTWQRSTTCTWHVAMILFTGTKHISLTNYNKLQHENTNHTWQ